MQEAFIKRQNVVIAFFIVAGLLLTIKLLHLQIIDPTYSNKANAVTISRHYIFPSRGLIYDRTGKLLVNNNPMYDIVVVVNELNPAMDTSKLCRLLHISKETFKEKINKDWSSRKFSKSLPFIFISQVPPEVYAAFQESLFEFPGFYVQPKNKRMYPFPNAANVMGYISEVDEKQIESSEGKYMGGDYIGSAGLELAYEDKLRGRKGLQYSLKNNLGKDVGVYKEGGFDLEPEAGTDLISSIDIELQAYAEKLLQNKTGSIVAIEPSTGEILAMVSSPGYDPNLLVLGPERGNSFQKLSTDTLKPFFDRSIMAKYPPGSIFKTVVGLVALEEGLTWPDRFIPCKGGYFYGDIKWGCHNHGPITSLALALQHSCNTYFFQLTRDIIDQYSFHLPGKGLSTFANYLDQFGLGKPFGIDYPNEKGGNIPTPNYYDKLYKRRRGWRSPTIMSIGIGQGEIQLTTLQMSNLAATIANRGYYYIPHLVKGFKDKKATIDSKFLMKNIVKINPENFDPIIDGMGRVVTFGTGRQAYMDGIPIAGKTGTSQNPRGEDHSVFFAFAPIKNPKIAIAVLVENAGRGADYAAPIGSLVIEKYINRDVKRLGLEEKMISINTVKLRPKRKKLPIHIIATNDSSSVVQQNVNIPLTSKINLGIQ